MTQRPPSWPVVRGLACPFDSQAVVAGVVETVAPGAFQVDPAKVEIHGLGHWTYVAAGCGEGGFRAWQNSVGLFFEVALRPSLLLPHLLSAIRTDQVGCSIRMDPRTWEFVEHGRADCPARRICFAEIDHIAIAPNPAYSKTAAWLATDEEAGRLSRRVSALAHLSGAGMFSRKLNLVPVADRQGAPRCAYA